ncbi:MAG: hypothetical protein K2N87_01240 [Eubacterium sp.]|nr:hypothetical protein [Eubacterium sp.]
MATRIPWSEQEEAVLLYYLLEILQKKIDKKTVIGKVSKKLQSLAVKKGIIIDERFRNEAEIALQMGKLEFAFTREKSGIPVKTGWYFKVELYENNHGKFEQLLVEDLDMDSMEIPSDSAQLRSGFAQKKPDARLAADRFTDSDTDGSFDEVIVVDLKETRSYAFTVPIAFSYFGERIEVSSWKGLYISCCKFLFKDYPQVFENLKGKSISDNRRIEVGGIENVSVMKTAKQIGSGIFVETNLSATDLMKKLSQLVVLCNVDFKNIKIEYREDLSKKAAVLTEKDIQSEKDRIQKRCVGFVEWMMNQGISKASIRDSLLALKQCDRYALDKHFTNRSLYLITSVSDLEIIKRELFVEDAVFLVFDEKMNNRFRAVLNTYIKFCSVAENNDCKVTGQSVMPQKSKMKETISITDQSYEKYTVILRKFFPDGLRQNIIHIKKFIQCYEEYFIEEIGIGRNELLDCLKSTGVVRDGRIYPRKSAEQRSLVDEILAEIMRVFQNGGTCIYFSMILQHYRQQLGEQLNVYNEEALQALLMECKPDDFNIHNGYISSLAIRADASSDVLHFMKNNHEPVTYNDMQSALWYLPMEKIKNALIHIPSIVNVDKETYFYAPNLPISASEQQILIRAMRNEIDQRGFLVGKHLKALIDENCPSTAIDTAFMKDWGLRNIIGYIFRDYFEFNDAIVVEKGQKFSVSDAYQGFCREREKLMLYELEEFSEDVNVSIYWDDVFSILIRISATEFVRKDKIHFDIVATDEIIDTLCTSDYIPIQDVRFFLQFPAIEIPWNGFVLECYLKQYSKRFRLDQVSVAKSGYYGVIVRKDSILQNYEQIVIDMLARSTEWNNEKSALELLVSRGYQARRRWNGFSNVIKKALLLREKLESKEK